MSELPKLNIVPGKILLILALFVLASNFLAIAAQDKTELSEAAEFLEKLKISKLKIYKLPGTSNSDIFPQIKNRLITSGDNFDKLKKASTKILDQHKLLDHCNVILFESIEPTVFTYKLRSISFSSSLVDILTADEISALTAHEIGHLYLAHDLLKARKENDLKLARIVELKSDAVSLVSLKAVGINPASLISAIEKLEKARKDSSYPISNDANATLPDRRELLDKYLKLSN